jgi:hypothetical protein
MITKRYEETFWYYTQSRDIHWGYTIPNSTADARGYKSEEEAHQFYLMYMNLNPHLKADSPINLPKDTTIFVDFDGTIYKGPLSDNYQDMAPPDPQAVRTIQQLHAAGYRITLYSCRSNPAVVGSNIRADQQTAHMTRYCTLHGIPYDNVEFFKPHYHLLIDDRAISGKDWNIVRSLLGMTP